MNGGERDAWKEGKRHVKFRILMHYGMCLMRTFGSSFQ
jgi:hypothetical protein